jgi:hypothetical protein
MFGKWSHVGILLATLLFAVGVGGELQVEQAEACPDCSTYADVCECVNIWEELCASNEVYCAGYRELLGLYPECAPVSLRGPGPDMVELPATAVVGTFTAAAELLYAPDASAGTGVTMTPGQSLWVYGVDSTGEFHKVVMSGSMFWVPVGSIEPNYDDVWDGMPLPVDVVE